MLQEVLTVGERGCGGDKKKTRDLQNGDRLCL
jgi:hypothetical protein